MKTGYADDKSPEACPPATLFKSRDLLGLFDHFHYHHFVYKKWGFPSANKFNDNEF